MKTLFLYLFMAVPGFLFAQPNCGFPGDTNNDGRADFLDLLPIGLRYGSGFEPRPDWSTDWFLQCFEPWPNSLPVTGINTGFSDADGNGAVDSLDADVIVFNYDSLHNEPAVPPAIAYNPPVDPAVPCATLFYTFRKDADDPTRFYADVFFDAPPTFPGAMAAAVRFTYEPLLVIDDSTRVLFDPADTDLMGVGAAFKSTSIQRQLPMGTVEMAVSGRGNQALQGPRQIGVVAFVITEDVIIRNDTVPFTLVFDYSLILTNLEQAVCHNTLTDTLKLIRVGLDAPVASDPRFYPNPATDVLYSDTPVQELALYDLSGKTARYYRQGGTAFPLGGLPSGAYIAVARTSDGYFRMCLQVKKP